MKRIILSLFFGLLVHTAFSQDNLSLGVSVGTSVLSDQQVTALMLEGRYHFNSVFSAGAGIGLINSWYKDTWRGTYSNLNAADYRLSDNQTMPSFQVNLRSEWPIFAQKISHLRLFAEPRLIFLPYTRRVVHLNETYMVGERDDQTQAITYQVRDNDPFYEGTYTSDNHLRLGWGLSLGVVFPLKNLDCSLGYAFNQLDLFHELRQTTLTSHEYNETINLNDYFSKKSFSMIQIGFSYRYREN